MTTFYYLNGFYDVIEELILYKRFIPFPPRPEAIQLNYQQNEKFPSNDGFENNSHLNMIAKTIVTHPNLVNLWKQIGYFEICNDYNDLVFQWVLLMLFPPTPAVLWTCPTTTCTAVISRLNEFISLGFKLHNKAIINILKRFKDRLCDIGDILWDAFFAIRSNEISNSSILLEVFLESVMQESVVIIQNFFQYMEKRLK